MARKDWLVLAGLAFSAFIMNTSEFMPIGLLVDIAAAFGMTEAGAGLIISLYAWAVAFLVCSMALVRSIKRAEAAA